jgi:hypothetical protein
VFQGSDGLSVEGVRALEVFSTFADKTITPKALKKAKKTLSRVFKEASTQSQHKNQDFDTFSIITRNADIALELNFELLGLVRQMKLQIDPASYGLTDKQMGLYANYFVQKAIGASSVDSASFALRALRTYFSDYVVLENPANAEEKNTIFLSNNGNQRLIYDMKSVFGIQSVVSDVREVTIQSLDKKGEPITVTSGADTKANQVGLDLTSQVSSLKPGVYSANFVFDTMSKGVSYSTKTFRVYKSMADSMEVNFLKQDQEYAEIEVTGIWEEYQTFLTLQLDDQLPYQVFGSWDAKNNRHLIKVNFTRTIMADRIPGKYITTVYAQAADKKGLVTYEIGSVNLNQGEMGNDNRLGRKDFELYEKIINIFDEPPAEKGSAVPLAFSLLILAGLLNFVVKTYKEGSNLTNFSFWGLLFSLNYLLVIFVIVAFWLKINLINTLWILVALTPVTLFTMNMGLNADNCHIGTFQKRVKSTK